MLVDADFSKRYLLNLGRAQTQVGSLSLGKPNAITLHLHQLTDAPLGAESDFRGVNVLSIIREAQRAGASYLRAIANVLNARGVRTARGGKWGDTVITLTLA